MTKSNVLFATSAALLLGTAAYAQSALEVVGNPAQIPSEYPEETFGMSWTEAETMAVDQFGSKIVFSTEFEPTAEATDLIGVPVLSRIGKPVGVIEGFTYNDDGSLEKVRVELMENDDRDVMIMNDDVIYTADGAVTIWTEEDLLTIVNGGVVERSS
ncbi:MAG: hypothetical protein AAGJ96_02465 [Pseudomonadota bacterium]